MSFPSKPLSFLALPLLFALGASQALGDSKQEWVRQNLSSGAQLDLDQILRLSWEDQGRRLLSVSIVAQGVQWGAAELIPVIDGRELLPLRVSPQLEEQRIYVDRVVGSDVRDLRVSVRGSVYVERVIAQFADSGWPGDPGQRREVTLNRWITPSAPLQLRQVLNLGPELDGVNLLSVEVTAQAQQSGAWITLLVNGQATSGSVSVDPYLRTSRIVVRRILGHDIRNLTLQISGAAVYIQSVAAVLDRGQGPGPGRRLVAEGQASNFGGNYPFRFQAVSQQDIQRQCLNWGRVNRILEVNYLVVNGLRYQWNGGPGARIEQTCQLITQAAQPGRSPVLR